MNLKQEIILVMLILLVFISAISVVYVTHYQRKLFIQLQELEYQKDELNIEWRKLLLEENSISTMSQIEEKAFKELDMRVPKSSDIIFIRL